MIQILYKDYKLISISIFIYEIKINSLDLDIRGSHVLQCVAIFVYNSKF